MNPHRAALLDDGFPEDLIDHVWRDIESGETPFLRAEQLCEETGGDPDDAVRILRRFCDFGRLEERTVYHCPNDGCPGAALSRDEAARHKCPCCQEDLPGDPAKLESELIFDVLGGVSRDVRWLVALHGMNTRGEWQEQFSWRIATKYRYSAPVNIYKYGLILSGAVSPWRLRVLVRRLARSLRRATREAARAGFGDRPDVIAHSLGTWLLGHALHEHSDLRVGRVILAGCTLRPDFDWQSLIDAERVEAVLNHFGTKDHPTKICQFLIPDSGPSGRLGFCSRGVLNVQAEGYAHSDFFLVDRMREQLADGTGLWCRFLSLPRDRLEGAIGNEPAIKTWRQAPAWRREPVRIAALAGFYVAIPLVTIWLGIRNLADDFREVFRKDERAPSKSDAPLGEGADGP